MYSLDRIAPIEDSYSLEELNCLEKPLGVALSSFDPLYRSIYLSFEKMLQGYNFYKYSEAPFMNKNTMKRSAEILKNELGILVASKKLKNESDFYRFIDENIKENNPIIVPVNLREVLMLLKMF